MKKHSILAVAGVALMLVAGAAWAQEETPETWTKISQNYSVPLQGSVDNPCTERQEAIQLSGEEHWNVHMEYSNLGNVKINLHSNHQGGDGLDAGPDGEVGTEDDVDYEVPGNYKLQIDTRQGMSMKVFVRCPLISHGSTPNFLFNRWVFLKINEDYTLTLKDEDRILTKCVGDGKVTSNDAGAEVEDV